MDEQNLSCARFVGFIQPFIACSRERLFLRKLLSMLEFPGFDFLYNVSPEK